MNFPPRSVRRRVTLVVSAAIVVSLYVMTRERSLSRDESEEVVNDFQRASGFIGRFAVFVELGPQSIGRADVRQ